MIGVSDCRAENHILIAKLERGEVWPIRAVWVPSSGCSDTIWQQGGSAYRKEK